MAHKHLWEFDSRTDGYLFYCVFMSKTQKIANGKKYSTFVSTFAHETGAKTVKYIYQGNPVKFRINGNNVMVSANDMAKPFGKYPTDWIQFNRTRKFLKKLSGIKKVAVSDLIIIENDGNLSTWFHEDVAFEFARWLVGTYQIQIVN
jgi:hypothetical protein